MGIWIPKEIYLYFQNVAFWNKTKTEDEIAKALRLYIQERSQNNK